MLLRKILSYHILPACVAGAISFVTIQAFPPHELPLILQPSVIKDISYAEGFKYGDLNNQLAFSLALKRGVPVVLGSSELTSGHLDGLAQNFFVRKPGDKFLSFGHAGFQSLGILTVLAANAALLQNAKITIILSPGWFEKMYSNGTSLNSFFEHCPPNYIYTLYNDQKLNRETRTYIQKYISCNFDKISKPDAGLRLFGFKMGSKAQDLANLPFVMYNEAELEGKADTEPYLRTQDMILSALNSTPLPRYIFKYPKINWDSLEAASKVQFKKISSGNSLAVEDNYYSTFLGSNRKKQLQAVSADDNQEYQDLQAMIRFLRDAQIKPLFVIMPLNKKAHQDVSVLQPIINDIDTLLKRNQFTYMDMFSPNAIKYEDGILEDIMHPYNLGWYRIDKFILDNFHDD